MTAEKLRKAIKTASDALESINNAVCDFTRQHSEENGAAILDTNKGMVARLRGGYTSPKYTATIKMGEALAAYLESRAQKK